MLEGRVGMKLVRSAAAGEVLYHWRVFPLHLDEPPVAAVSSSAGGQPPEAALVLKEMTAAVVKGQAQGLGGSVAVNGGGDRTATGEQQAGSEQCTAWPPGRGLEEGPVVFRWGFATTSQPTCLIVCHAGSNKLPKKMRETAFHRTWILQQPVKS